MASILIFAVLSLLSKLDDPHDVDQLSQLQGLFWQHPWLASIMTLGLLSLAGMPITIGFIGKFYVLTLAVKTIRLVVNRRYVGWQCSRFILLLTGDFYLVCTHTKRKYTLTPGAYFTKIWIGIIAVGLLLLGILPGLLGDQLRSILVVG